MTAQRVKIVERDRIAIPAAMRRELGIGPGDTALVDIAGGKLRVRSILKAVEHAWTILRRHIADGVDLTDELIADRRCGGGA